MRSRVYETVRSPHVCLYQQVHTAANPLLQVCCCWLPRARRAGDIDRLLHGRRSARSGVRRANAGSATLSEYHWRSEGVRAAHRAALASGGKRAKIVIKNSRENSDCIISYVFACNKNRALQLQRVPILSILGYDIDLYFKQALQFPKT